MCLKWLCPNCSKYTKWLTFNRRAFQLTNNSNHSAYSSAKDQKMLGLGLKQKLVGEC